MFINSLLCVSNETIQREMPNAFFALKSFSPRQSFGILNPKYNLYLKDPLVVVVVNLMVPALQCMVSARLVAGVESALVLKR